MWHASSHVILCSPAYQGHLDLNAGALVDEHNKWFHEWCKEAQAIVLRYRPSVMQDFVAIMPRMTNPCVWFLL